MNGRHDTKTDPITVIALLLLIIGGLNWLLFAFGFNLVEALFGDSIIATLIYILVGLSAIYMLYPLYLMLTHRYGTPT